MGGQIREAGGQGKAQVLPPPLLILTPSLILPLQSSKQAETSRLQEELAKVGLLSFPWTLSPYNSPPAMLLLAGKKDQSNTPPAPAKPEFPHLKWRDTHLCLTVAFSIE